MVTESLPEQTWPPVVSWTEPCNEPECLAEAPLEPSMKIPLKASSELLMDDPREPLMETSPEVPLGPPAEVSTEPLVEVSRKPFVEAELEPRMGVRCQPLTEALKPLLLTLTDTWPEPSVAVSTQPLVVTRPELLVEPGPRRGVEDRPEPTASREPWVMPEREARPELVTKASREPLMEASRELLVRAPEACPPPSVEAWAGHDLVAHVLKECLEEEKTRKPSLTGREERRIVSLAGDAILKGLAKVRNDVPISNLSISDFECFSWKWLKLALLMRANGQQEPTGTFTDLITQLEEFVSRPIGLSDTWFLAGVLQRFLGHGCLSRWLPRGLASNCDWGCRRLIFRVSFPNDVLRLPETEDCIKRVCAISKLDWWLRQAKRNIRIDEETWTSFERPAELSRIQRNLGKRTFDAAIETMRVLIQPPSYLSNLQYIACLLKYIEISPPKIRWARRSETSRSSLPSSSSSVPPEAVPPESVPPEAVPPETVPPEAVPPETVPPEAVPSSSVASSSQSLVDPRSWVNTNSSIDPNKSVDRDRSISAEMATFMALTLNECAERERTENSVLTEAEKGSVARFAAYTLRRVISSVGEKSVSGRGRSVRANPFNNCKWRWLCLVGLMNDYLEPNLFHELIADCEKRASRPKHVSPLWYLACRMQVSLSPREIAAGFNSCLKALPAWWTSSSSIYQDHFPHDFGELPMSEMSARLIAFSSRAAHWLASGLPRFRLTPKTWSRTPNRDVVDVFHTVLGQVRFSQMINLIKPKLCKLGHTPLVIGQATDKTIMEAVLKYAKVDRRLSLAFCKAWQCDVTRPDGTTSDSSGDEPPTKRKSLSGV
ncbi:hypothetical protein GNI_012130 [Gregarina niphandrodes]|uniref:Uncharacterized protein n=1 Tax=Gregarina niphandrodes TaxID=110365 RepID=A0A023BCP6_GRENI|nr:hypothetical protein GNI_012130 [Gregarina niphandrodes]EZG85053.1 hypothetical protein GNI_012130 [Gregarina niphandrodes]|eukprot:XP_011128846.1 hypothetical protein GNI_012130 [Gregarina niphandrodes]